MKQYIKYSLAALASLLVLSGIFISCANDVTDTIEKESFKFFASFAGENPNQRFGLDDNNNRIDISWTDGPKEAGADVIQIFDQKGFVTESEVIVKMKDPNDVMITFPMNNRMKVGETYTAYAMNSASHKALGTKKANELDSYYQKNHSNIDNPIDVITNQSYWKSEFKLENGENNIKFQGDYAVVGVILKNELNKDITFKKATLKLNDKPHEVNFAEAKTWENGKELKLYFNVGPKDYSAAEIEIAPTSGNNVSFSANISNGNGNFENWKFYERNISTGSCPTVNNMSFSIIADMEILPGSDGRTYTIPVKGQSARFQIYTKDKKFTYFVGKDGGNFTVLNPSLENVIAAGKTDTYIIKAEGKSGCAYSKTIFIKGEAEKPLDCPSDGNTPIKVDAFGNTVKKSVENYIETYEIISNNTTDRLQFQVLRGDDANQSFIYYFSRSKNGPFSVGSLIDYINPGEEIICYVKIEGPNGCSDNIIKEFKIKRAKSTPVCPTYEDVFIDVTGINGYKIEFVETEGNKVTYNLQSNAGTGTHNVQLQLDKNKTDDRLTLDSVERSDKGADYKKVTPNENGIITANWNSPGVILYKYTFKSDDSKCGNVVKIIQLNVTPCPEANFAAFTLEAINGNKLSNIKKDNNGNITADLIAGKGTSGDNTYEISKNAKWYDKFKVEVKKNGTTVNPSFPIKEYGQTPGTIVYVFTVKSADSLCGNAYQQTITINVKEEAKCEFTIKEVVLNQTIGNYDIAVLEVQATPISPTPQTFTYQWYNATTGEKLEGATSDYFNVTYTDNMSPLDVKTLEVYCIIKSANCGNEIKSKTFTVKYEDKPVSGSCSLVVVQLKDKREENPPVYAYGMYYHKVLTPTPISWDLYIDNKFYKNYNQSNQPRLLEEIPGLPWNIKDQGKRAYWIVTTKNANGIECRQKLVFYMSPKLN